MRPALFCVLAGLLVLCATRAALADSCGDFAVEVATAEHAYADYAAYVKSGDSDEAGIAFKAFSHLLDVADEYSDKCEVAGHKAVFESYTRLGWYKNEGSYSEYVGLAEAKHDIANAQSEELKFLWALGFGKTNPGEYSVMKSTTARRFAELGLTFYSPESGKVIVQGNPSLANCNKNDHDAGFAGVTLAYPSDAAAAKLGGRYNIEVLIDESGVAKSATATIDGIPDLSQLQLATRVGNELAAEAQAATWQPTVVACKTMTEDLLNLTVILDPATGAVTLERWHDTSEPL